MSKRRLGRGLDALISTQPQPYPEAEPTGGASVLDIELGRIELNPDQPRERIDADALNSLTDSIRSVSLGRGLSAHAMMRSPWGRWLVVSPAMRTVYAVVKATAFTLLAAALGLRSGGWLAWKGVWAVAVAFSWASLVLCLLRGVPVIVEANRLFRDPEFLARGSQSAPKPSPGAGGDG